MSIDVGGGYNRYNNIMLIAINLMFYSFVKYNLLLKTKSYISKLSM